MSHPAPQLTRREILQRIALGALALPVIGSSALRAAEPEAKAGPRLTPVVEGDGREHGLKLGIATYSTRLMTLDETIATLQVLRIKNAGVVKAHCNWETVTVDEARACGTKLRTAGINVSATSVLNLPNDEAALRKIFENVKAGGVAVMVCKPVPAALPLVSKLAQEFNQKLAIHNHGPEDAVFPTPQSVWDAVKSLDERVGLCIDIGHTARAKVDPVAAIKQFAPRLYDLHMKDTLAIPGGVQDIPMEVGAGRLDIRGVLRTLLDLKYNGVVAFEYEKAGNPVTGLAESIGYVRGLLAAMA